MYLEYDTDLKHAIPEEDLIDLTDDEKLRQVGMTAVNDGIRDACAEFDSYAGVRYAVPVSPVTDEIKRIVKDLWKCYMYERRPGNVPEDIKLLRERTTSTLRDISKGLKTLGVDPAPAATTQGSPEVRTGERAFTRGKLEGF